MNTTITLGNKPLVKAITYLIYAKIALEVIGFIVALILIIWFLGNNNDWGW